MRFLANENFPLTSIKIIRKAGYDMMKLLIWLKMKIGQS